MVIERQPTTRRAIIRIDRSEGISREEYIEVCKLKLKEIADLGHMIPWMIALSPCDEVLKVEVEFTPTHFGLPRGVTKLDVNPRPEDEEDENPFTRPQPKMDEWFEELKKREKDDDTGGNSA